MMQGKLCVWFDAHRYISSTKEWQKEKVKLGGLLEKIGH